ncbi:MAG TPA: FAD-dependent oxidoreductase [Candidatus Woesebacteria bacterium]|nr:FAD-dependent oxidoreductase [Candidatus Woesebacteria bacterium]
MKKLQLAIIGSGPAGLTAGIYTSRARIETTLFAGLEIGGQLMYTSGIENFPGVCEGKTGPLFMMDLQKQAMRFGTTIQYEQITAVDFTKKPFALWTNLPPLMDQKTFQSAGEDALLQAMQTIRQTEANYVADVLIIATGASSITLNVPGEKEYFGRGVSTCAVCDAAFYQDKNVYVIGGGDSAMEDSIALTKFAKQVTIIHRGDAFRASKIMQERVLANPKVKVMWNSNLKEISGDSKIVKTIKVETDGKLQELPTDGVFLAIGHQPNTGLFRQQLNLDRKGYIELKPHEIYSTMTSVAGVFAAGDVTDHRYRQAIVAAGLGAQAALDVEHYLLNLS